MRHDLNRPLRQFIATRHALLLASITLLLGLVFAPAAGLAQTTDDWWGDRDPADLTVFVEIVDPFSPFSSATFEWKMRGSSAMVTAVRTHLGGFSEDTELSLLTADEYLAALRTAGDCRAAVAMESPNELDLERSRELHAQWTMTVRLEGLEADDVVLLTPNAPGIDSCLGSLVGHASSHISWEAYRMPFWTRDTYGMLRADANVPAELWVDGQRTGEMTPVLDLRLEPGEHVLTWVHPRTGEHRNETITTRIGQTLEIQVQLDDR